MSHKSAAGPDWPAECRGCARLAGILEGGLCLTAVINGPGHRHQRGDHDTVGSANCSRSQGSPQMVRLYGASARSARARRTYNHVIDGAP